MQNKDIIVVTAIVEIKLKDCLPFTKIHYTRLVQSFTDIFGLVPANFQIPTKLCTDLPKGMNKRFSVGDIFFTLGKTQEGHAHLTMGKF